jgi:hypothetical protein
MSKVKILISGVYKVPFTQKLYNEAYLSKYSGIRIPFWRKNKVKKQLIEELSNIVLIELIVNEFDDTFNIDSFKQPERDQAPYHEVFLNADGTEVISDGSELPEVDKMRVCFFLHYYDPNKPLNTVYGVFDLPEVLELPKRLKDLIQYTPVY